MKGDEGFAFLGGIFIGGVICLFLSTLGHKNIESKNKIIPKIIITSEGNKTDTLYIYKK